MKEDAVLEVASVLPEAIYDELRSLIVDQSYGPGTSITESAVALRFGVARPSRTARGVHD